MLSLTDCDATSTSAASDDAAAVGARQQALRDDPLQAARDADAVLGHVAPHEREHAVHGAHGVARVQRRQDEVARLGRLERDLHRLLVADLADEDDVRILPQRRAQRRGEARRVEADLALADARHLVAVQELDGVLDRDDVQRARRVQVRDHARDRRALAVARRADDEHHPVLPLGELARRPASAARACSIWRDVGRDEAHHDREGAALAVHVDAEAADARRRYDVSYSLSSSRCARTSGFAMTMRATASVSSGGDLARCGSRSCRRGCARPAAARP